MRKYIFLLLLNICVAASAATYSGTCGANLRWSLDTAVGDLYISGRGAMTEYSESNRAPWYQYRQYILRLLMDDSVTSIGNYAFDQCSSLRYAYIPVALTSGGQLAMRGCTALKEVYWNARNLTSYYGPLNQASSVETMVFGDSVRVIGGSVVSKGYNNQLRRVEFGPNITQINNYAFSSCRNVDTVVWNVRRYATSVSYGSGAPLRCMIIGDSVRYIGNSTCSSNAHKIRVPYGVDTLRFSAFGYWGGKLDTIIWAARAPHIITEGSGSQIMRLFNEQEGQIRAILFEEGVEHIPEYLCVDMDLVEEIHLPSTVVSIGEWAFAGMDNLKRVNVPYSLRSIHHDLFNNCNSLKHIRWEAEDCRLTGDNLPPFYYRLKDSLETWTFGDSVRVIPGRVCYYEHNLKHVRIPASVDSIGPEAFFDCNALQTIEVDPANAHYDSRDGSNTLICTARDSLICGATYSRIPASVRAIAPNAFRGLTHLVWAELRHPDVVIGQHAFADIEQVDSIYWNVRRMDNTPFYAYQPDFGLQLISINPKVQYCTFGDSVEAVPAYFCYQMTLDSLYFPYALQSAGQQAFSACTAPYVVWNAAHCKVGGFTNSPLYAMRNSIQELTIGDSVHLVPGQLMYSDCPLQVLRLSASVDSIGNQAFKGCGSLQDIYCASVNPPGGSIPFPTALYSKTTVHVPCGSPERYGAHRIWGRFATIVEEEVNDQPCAPSALISMEETENASAATKVIRNGRLMILRNDMTYTVLGQVIR